MGLAPHITIIGLAPHITIMGLAPHITIIDHFLNIEHSFKKIVYDRKNPFFDRESCVECTVDLRSAKMTAKKR